jgi:hypothetical protein
MLYFLEKMCIIITVMVKIEIIRGLGKFFCDAGHENKKEEMP